MTDATYFRICVLPTGISIILFWMLNLPLLFFNFFPNLNPMERWKIQKGRHETAHRVAWMVVLVLINQTIAMAISMSPQNYDGLLDLGYQSGLDSLPTLGDLSWQIPTCCYLYDAIFFCCHCLMHTKWLYHNIHKGEAGRRGVGEDRSGELQERAEFLYPEPSTPVLPLPSSSQVENHYRHQLCLLPPRGLRFLRDSGSASAPTCEQPRSDLLPLDDCIYARDHERSLWLRNSLHAKRKGPRLSSLSLILLQQRIPFCDNGRLRTRMG